MVTEPFVLGFVGFAAPEQSDDAAAYEDAVLPLLADHGARLLYRGRRAAGEDPALPLELHLVWFPDREALDAFLADERRTAAIERYGTVFSQAYVVRMDTIGGTLAP